MTDSGFTGEDSAAFYTHLDCCIGRDMANAVGLFQTYAIVIGRNFHRFDRLDMQAHANLGW